MSVPAGRRGTPTVPTSAAPRSGRQTDALGQWRDRSSGKGKSAREVAVSGVESISLDTPQETRKFPHGEVQLVTVGGSTVGRFTFEPGWRWSTSVKPIVGTDRCENHHVGYALSGRMHVVDAAGIGTEIGAGEAYDIAPGHDAWITGKDTFVGLEFRSADQYAKPK